MQRDSTSFVSIGTRDTAYYTSALVQTRISCLVFGPTVETTVAPLPLKRMTSTGHLLLSAPPLLAPWKQSSAADQNHR